MRLEHRRRTIPEAKPPNGHIPNRIRRWCRGSSSPSGGRVRSADGQQLKPVLSLSFPYVCPEPVLVQ
jgi:hypothetical protein